MKVLVTGHLGYCGAGIVKALLDDGLYVVGFDRATGAGAAENANFHEIQGDVTNLASVFSAVKSCDAIIHAAVGNRVCDHAYDQYQTVDLPYGIEKLSAFHINVTGTFNVFEVARQLGIRQVVLLSSAAVVYYQVVDELDGSVRDVRLRADSPPNFKGIYGLNKHMQEQIAWFYAREYGMSVITLRPWWVVDGPSFQNRYGQHLASDRHVLCPAAMVCRTDLGRVCSLALQRPDITYDVFYPVAGPERERYFDVEHLHRELGWQPQYTFETLIRD